MTIYIEYVIIDNFVINLLILTLTTKLLKIFSKKLFLFLSALFGTIIAVISPLLPNIINILLKLPLALSMIIIAFNPKTIKQFFAEFIIFLISTFAMIGTCLAIAEIFNIDVSVQNGIIMDYKFPVGAILLICFVVYLSLINSIKFIFKKQNNSNHLFEITIKHKNKTIKTVAFLDTGNKLKDNNKPISIIGYKTFFKLYPNINLSDILLNKKVNIENSKYIEVYGIGEGKKILIFEIDELIVAQKNFKNALLGLSGAPFQQSTDSDVIISGTLLGDNYEFKKN